MYLLVLLYLWLTLFIKHICYVFFALKNIGHNLLHGTMPLLLLDKTQIQTTDDDEPTNCVGRRPFKKIGLQWLDKKTSPNIEPLVQLQTLSLSEFIQDLYYAVMMYFCFAILLYSSDIIFTYLCIYLPMALLKTIIV